MKGGLIYPTKNTPKRNTAMKTKASKKSQKAFSLIELITVIAVIVILVAMTMGILGSAQTKGGIELTKTQLGMYVTYLEKYKAKYGEYPQSAGNGGDTQGAKVLYQAFTGDGANLLGGDGSSNGKLEKIERDKNLTLIDPENDPQNLVGKDKGKDFVLRDGFGNAWQYRSYSKDNSTEMNNSTYDLWSYGTDKEQRDERKWIKNW